MRNLKGLFFSAFITLVVISCGPGNQNRAEKSAAPVSEAMSDSLATEGASSSAALATSTDTARKFIRTADLKFRVQEVVKATYQIEDMVKANGGFVTVTNLSSDNTDEDRSRVSDDSVLLVTHYTIRNYMTIRVPNTLLDTTLKQIARIVEFLDYRNIKATDVGLDVLSNRLAVARSRKHNQRIDPMVEGAKNAGDKLNASESMMNSDEKADQAAIANMGLADQINFSTIQIEIYQRPSTRYTLIADARSYDNYRPGFGTQIAEAFGDGFQLFKYFILFLVRIWWLILLALIAFVVYPVYRRRRNKKI